MLPSRFRAYGVPKVWYFPCMPRFWRDLLGLSPAKLSPEKRPLLEGSPDAIVAQGADGSAAQSIEAPDAELRDRAAAGRAVTVTGLRKEFDTPDGVKVAVDGVDMVFYEGQISVLLGACDKGMPLMQTGYIPCASHIRSQWRW